MTGRSELTRLLYLGALGSERPLLWRIWMARKLARPVYETRHEEMLAQEREYAMELQDRTRSLERRLAVFSRYSWVKRTGKKPQG